MTRALNIRTLTPQVKVSCVSPQSISDAERQRAWRAIDERGRARLAGLTPEACLLSLSARALVLLLADKTASVTAGSSDYTLRVDQAGGLHIFDGALFFAHASISHTYGQVAAALNCAGPVGVDIEWTRRPARYLAVARRAFSADAHAALLQAPPSELASRFFVEWTLRESLVKACQLRGILALKTSSFEKIENCELVAGFVRLLLVGQSLDSCESVSYLGTAVFDPGWRISVAVRKSSRVEASGGPAHRSPFFRVPGIAL